MWMSQIFLSMPVLGSVAHRSQSAWLLRWWRYQHLRALFVLQYACLRRIRGNCNFWLWNTGKLALLSRLHSCKSWVWGNVSKIVGRGTHPHHNGCSSIPSWALEPAARTWSWKPRTFWCSLAPFVCWSIGHRCFCRSGCRRRIFQTSTSSKL